MNKTFFKQVASFTGFLILMSLWVMSGCSNLPQKSISNQAIEATSPEENSSVPQVDLPEVVVEAPKLKPIFRVGQYINHTDAERARNEKAVEVVREVANGECFRKGMIERSLTWTNGKSREQVVDDILNSEPIVNFEMYYQNTSTVGFTYPSDPTLHFNRKFHDHYNICTVGSNTFHEVSHKKGYRHQKYNLPSRKYTVPYSINVVFEKCCKEIR